MVVARIAEQVEHAARRAGLRIRGAIHDPFHHQRNPRMHDRHRTRAHRDTAPASPCTEAFADTPTSAVLLPSAWPRAPHRHDLRVRR
jgi:hypothetical protein